MSPQIKYAYKTHNTWVYRRTYPKALQPLLGSALKQSLKTGDAREAKLRVAELNQTFTTIIKEAQAHALATPHTDTPTAAQGPRLAVGRPRYQRARLVGERLVADLAQAYLAGGVSASTPWQLQVGALCLGAALLASRWAVLLVTCPSPWERRSWGTSPSSLPTCASTGTARRLAWLSWQGSPRSRRVPLSAPQTQARILKQMSQFLDWCVGEGELVANPWEALKGQRQAMMSTPMGC